MADKLIIMEDHRGRRYLIREGQEQDFVFWDRAMDTQTWDYRGGTEFEYYEIEISFTGPR